MDFEKLLVEELMRVHGAHTVLLYGSRARGDDTPESDVDVTVFADVPEVIRDARVWRELMLDVFVQPTESAGRAEIEQLKLVGARVLLDARGLGAPLLLRLEALEKAGPAPLAETEARMRCVWARKMMMRVGRGDLEANYRRVWLLYQLLEDHFALAGRWYRGPKQAFVELEREAPSLHAAFARALAPGAPHLALVELVDQVVRSHEKFGSPD